MSGVGAFSRGDLDGRGGTAGAEPGCVVILNWYMCGIDQNELECTLFLVSNRARASKRL